LPTGTRYYGWEVADATALVFWPRRGIP
jgi:hypothetical protein